MALKKKNSIDDVLDPEKPKPSLIAWLRSRFLAGIVIAAPIAITLSLVAALISWIDARIKPLIPRAWNPETYIDAKIPFTDIPVGIPGLGVIVAVILLTLLGSVGANLIGRSMIQAGDRFLSNVPVVRNIYSLFKQLFETIANTQQTSFKDMVLVEYPKKGTWCIGFVTAPVQGEVKARLGGDMIGVFVPTTPNPTSGFYMFVPKAEVIDLDMTVEEGAKMIVSVGMVVPDHLTTDQIEDVISQIPPADDQSKSA